MGHKHNYLKGSSSSTSSSLSRTAIVSMLGYTASLSQVLWPGLQCRMWIPSCGVSRKTNQEVIGYTHSRFATAIQVGTCCLVSIVPCRTHSWGRPLTAFLPQQPAQHCTGLWGPTRSREAPMSAPARFCYVLLLQHIIYQHLKPKSVT